MSSAFHELGDAADPSSIRSLVCRSTVLLAGNGDDATLHPMTALYTAKAQIFYIVRQKKQDREPVGHRSRSVS